MKPPKKNRPLDKPVKNKELKKTKKANSPKPPKSSFFGKVLAENRRAKFQYDILEKYQAGLVLMGSEVKSIKSQSCQLKDSYIAFVGHEAFLQKAHIAEYKASSYNNHSPERLRKLLLQKKELHRIQASMQQKGLACVPLKVYVQRGKIKIQIALVKGRQDKDKRQYIKEREAKRSIQKALSSKKRYK